jgi:hypothetical protein
MTVCNSQIRRKYKKNGMVMQSILINKPSNVWLDRVIPCLVMRSRQNHINNTAVVHILLRDRHFTTWREDKRFSRASREENTDVQGGSTSSPLIRKYINMLYKNKILDLRLKLFWENWTKLISFNMESWFLYLYG